MYARDWCPAVRKAPSTAPCGRHPPLCISAAPPGAPLEANAAAAATTSAGRWQTERRQRCGHGVAQLRPGVGGGRGGGDRGRQLAWPPDGARHGGSVGSSPPFRLWKLGPGQTPAALQWGLPTDPPPPLVTPHPPRPAFPPLEGEEKHAEEMGALPSLPVRSPLLNVVADTGTSFSSRVPPLPPTAPPSPSPPAHASASQARERQSGRHPSWAKGGEPPHCARLATGRPCVSFPPNGCRGGGQRAGMTAGRGQGAAPRRGRGSAPAAGIWPAGPLAAVRKAGSRSPPPPRILTQKSGPVAHTGLLATGPTRGIKGLALLPTPPQGWGSGRALPRRPRPDSVTRGGCLSTGTRRVSRRGGDRVSGPEKTPARAPAGVVRRSYSLLDAGAARSSWARRPARSAAGARVSPRCTPSSGGRRQPRHPLRAREAPGQRLRNGDKRPCTRVETGGNRDDEGNTLITPSGEVRCPTGCAPGGRVDSTLREESV